MQRGSGWSGMFAWDLEASFLSSVGATGHHGRSGYAGGVIYGLYIKAQRGAAQHPRTSLQLRNFFRWSVATPTCHAEV